LDTGTKFRVFYGLQLLLSPDVRRRRPRMTRSVRHTEAVGATRCGFRGKTDYMTTCGLASVRARWQHSFPSDDRYWVEFPRRSSAPCSLPWWKWRTWWSGLTVIESDW